MQLRAWSIRSTNWLSDIERFLSRWRLAVSADGTIWIQANPGPLDPADLNLFLKKITRGAAKAPPRRLVLDLSEARFNPHDWTAAAALVVDAAKPLHASIRAVGPGLVRDELMRREGLPVFTDRRCDCDDLPSPLADPGAGLCFVFDRHDAR